MDMRKQIHNRYLITKDGKVINRKTNNILKIAKNGYCSITVCSITTKINIAKELARLYIDNPNNYKYVKCTDPQHPSINNTIWVQGKQTSTNKKVIRVNDGKLYNSMTDAGIDNFVSRSNIYACCVGKIKQAGGFKWSFV
ncbi:MAG: hypothetical protein RSC24_06455 [Clostridium sp.]